MSNFKSTAFLSPPPRVIPHTPPSLSITSTPSLQPVSRLVLTSFDSARDVPHHCNLIGQQRASSTDLDPNGEQSRITMQTRVAVRDASPHRFQVIPLREHKRCNTPETPPGRSNEPRYRSHELSRPAGFQKTSISEPLSCLSYVDRTDKSSSVSSAYSLRVPQVLAYKHGSIVLPSPDNQTPTFAQVEKRGATTITPQPLPHWTKPDNTLHASSSYEHRNSPSVFTILPLSPECADPQKPYQRNAESNIIAQDTGPATRRIKCRICSQDLTHCRDRKCTHGLFCLRCPCGDASWHTTVTVTRRRAIYTDTLVIPTIGRGSSTRHMSRTPVAHDHRGDQLSRYHLARPYYSRGASNPTSDKGLPTGTRTVFSSQPGNIISPPEVSCPNSLPAEDSSPVPRLRLFKKTHNLSTSRASSTHKGFAQHSNTVSDLIAQLDQAIKDWRELERDHAVLCGFV